MNLSDGPLLLCFSSVIFGWGVALGIWWERNRPGGVRELRERLRHTRIIAHEWRDIATSHHPVHSGGKKLSTTPAAKEREQLRLVKGGGRG